MFIKCDSVSRHPVESLTFDEFMGAVLSACRAELGLTRLSFAAMLDISVGELKHIEAGTRRPSAAVLIEIAGYFGLSPSKLLFEYIDLFGSANNVQPYGNVIFFASNKKRYNN